MINWLKEVELIGNKVKLIPLNEEHRSALVKASSDGKLWELWYTSVPSESTVDDYMKFALLEKRAKRALAFVVIDSDTDAVIGSTRYCNALNENRLEIGYTWYSKSYQKTSVNAECKLLLLEYAFEVLDCIAVEFRTHWFNENSRKAIAKLGAKQDGVIRNHLIDKDGAMRDTVVFSIIRNEWKVVKKSLHFRLNKEYE